MAYQQPGMYVGPPPIGQPPPGQWGQPPPVYGQPPPGYQAPPAAGPVAQALVPPGYTPPFNPANDPEHTRAPNDGIHIGNNGPYTNKEMFERYALVAVIFYIAGGVTMWYFFPIMFKVFSATQTALNISFGFKLLLSMLFS